MTPRELEIYNLHYKISQLKSGIENSGTLDGNFGKIVLLIVGAIMLSAGKIEGIIPMTAALVFWYLMKYQIAIDNQKIAQYEREICDRENPERTEKPDY